MNIDLSQSGLGVLASNSEISLQKMAAEYLAKELFTKSFPGKQIIRETKKEKTKKKKGGKK
jgi:hypothetical protein